MAQKRFKAEGVDLGSARAVNFTSDNPGLTVSASINADTGELDVTFDIVEESLVFGRVVLTDGVAAPSETVGQAKVYVDTADGDLKVKFGDANVGVVSDDT